METMTTTRGTVYEVNGLTAWPQHDPDPPLTKETNMTLWQAQLWQVYCWLMDQATERLLENAPQDQRMAAWGWLRRIASHVDEELQRDVNANPVPLATAVADLLRR